MRTVLPLLLSLVVLAGCAAGPRVARADALRDTPDRFLVATPGGAELPDGSATCRSPLVDPRDGTRLTLDRSVNGLGDYRVEAGRYGVPAGGWLRVACATGRPLGVVGR